MGHLTLDVDAIAQLVAVVIGAFLATIGGYLASQIEHGVRRRERERSAALLFGEILASLRLILGLADQARGRGDPYGPVTMRLVRAAHREADTYDRNRETLFDLADPVIRARTHTLLVRLTLALDGVLDAHEQADAARLALGTEARSPTVTQMLEERLQLNTADREGSFSFAVMLAGEITPLLDDLKGIARYSFEAQQQVPGMDLRRRTAGDAGSS
jgi:hypothetical protein